MRSPFRLGIAVLFVGALCFSGQRHSGAGEPIALQKEGPKTAVLIAKPHLVYKEREDKASAAVKTRLANMRKTIAGKKYTFTVGYTSAMDVPLAKLTGARPPADLGARVAKQNAMAARLLKLDKIQLDQYVKLNPEYKKLLLRPSPTLKQFDWRTRGKVTPVRDQGQCGSCWAFGTIGAFEGSFALRNNSKIDTSEQQVLNCSGVGTCGGGWWAFDYVVGKGVASETTYPYAHTDKPCKTSASHPFRGVAWGYVSGSSSTMPTVKQLKEALCTHGPIGVAVRATPLFQGYNSGSVFNEMAPGPINHIVTLIGWDDNRGAWLIKNSWGTLWGDPCGYGTERGYMWIKYGSNSVGYGAAWVDAKNQHYPLHKDFLQIFPYKKLIETPGIKPKVALPGLKQPTLAPPESIKK